MQRGGRFIPARAGNRYAVVDPETLNAVHPRACGEQYGFGKGSVKLDGSSPRVRGTVTNWLPVVVQRRFIPARAGNR